MKPVPKFKVMFLSTLCLSGLVLLLNLAVLDGTAAAYEPEALNSVTPLAAKVVAKTNTWMSVYAPFKDDGDADSYATFEYSTSSSGPWTEGCAYGVGGEAFWRYCAFGGLSANTDYFIQVTFTDPDGVNGANPQILGPIRTLGTGNNVVNVRPISVKPLNTYILVSVPIRNDSNMNSQVTVQVATDPNGPWTEKCGPPTGFAPKLCRIHGLTQNTDYWIRATVTDPDGISGTNPQTVGPVHYAGRTNLALNKAITADTGWGCCPSPSHLVDGRIQNPAWYYGFAWCGGTAYWCGVGPGWKQATIDLGGVQSISRVDWWPHDPNSVPTTWKVEVSSDGVNYTQVFFTNEPRCRTATETFDVSWGNPSCGHSAKFASTPARYVRYSFDDSTLFGGIHGWAVELEVFGP